MWKGDFLDASSHNGMIWKQADTEIRTSKMPLLLVVLTYREISSLPTFCLKMLPSRALPTGVNGGCWSCFVL